MLGAVSSARSSGGERYVYVPGSSICPEPRLGKVSSQPFTRGAGVAGLFSEIGQVHGRALRRPGISRAVHGSVERWAGRAAGLAAVTAAETYILQQGSV